MIDQPKLEQRTLILGAIENIGLDTMHFKTSEVLPALTATVTIYDSAGGTTLSATAMTMGGSGTAYMSASYLLSTGAGKTITAAGTYRAIYAVTDGTEVW